LRTLLGLYNKQQLFMSKWNESVFDIIHSQQLNFLLSYFDFCSFHVYREMLQIF